MKLNEYSPKELLLTVDAIQNVSSKYSDIKDVKLKQDKNKEVTLTLIVNLFLNLITLIPNFAALSNWAQVMAIIILAVLFIYIIISAVKWYEAYNKLKTGGDNLIQIDQMMIEKAKNNLRYTAIIRVVYKEKNKVLYLTGPDYFLPHSNMDYTKEISEQNENIIQCLNDDFSIQQRDILDIKPVDNEVHYSIKPIHENLQMNAFVFYDVFIKIQSKQKLTQNNSKRCWLTIDEMKRKPEAMSTNKDVINLLETLPAPNNSFLNILGNIKVIWNITSECPYNCSICATHDPNRNELSANDKLKVLNSICTAKSSIKNIDFAGGDPLHADESITIIQAAIEQLGEDRISITTTGAGVSESIKNKFSSAVKHCEITIDAAHSNLAYRQEQGDSFDEPIFSRDEEEYCSTNIDQINTLLEYAETMTINVPIINDDLSEEEINRLINKIVSIKNHHPNVDIDVTLLRLMPVGKMVQAVDKHTYTSYNPINVVRQIKNKLEANNIICKLHCSLRLLPDLGENGYCNMLENKLGIDCAGNVFSCAWGGYVLTSESIKKNPFYLGNLTKVSLIDILEGRSKNNQYRNIVAEINANNKRKYCSVVSFYEKKEMFDNCDPLSNSI